MAARLFGTDGIRGVANVELTAELALGLGRAAGETLVAGSGAQPGADTKTPSGAGTKAPTDESTKTPSGESPDLGKPRISAETISRRPRVFIGSDTRASSPMLAAALTAGFCSVGVDVVDLGIIPTPAVAYLTREQDAAAGAVISASHNPAPDNGIKFFGADGYKLPDATEDQIEAALRNGSTRPHPTGESIGRVSASPITGALYESHLVSTVGEGALAGLKVVLDCANGAAFEAGPHAFAASGAEVVVINAEPDGSNINADCGSTHPAGLAAAVLAEQADLGLAFDGDADRVLAVDAEGQVVDGDQILVICAKWLASEGRLPGERIVATVMSNLGLHIALRQAGIEVIECAVGDRYVIEVMRRDGISLGGEQSGHVIFNECCTTGDGLLTGLQIMHVMVHTGFGLARLAAAMTRLPQVLVNVPVADKSRLDHCDAIRDAVAAAESQLGENGRVLLRPSGTEQLVRVMVEAASEAEAGSLARALAQLVEEELAQEQLA